MVSPRTRRGLPVLAASLTASLALHALPARALEHPVSTILFASMDCGRSTFVNAGAKIALDDVDREGFVALVTAGGGVRQERGDAAPGSRAPTFTRTTAIGAALGGYQFFRDWGVLSLFAGPEVSLETVTGPGATAVSPARFGLRMQAEIWARTGPNTLSTLTLILGSGRWDVYGRASTGYRMWGAYIGPEIGYYGDRTGYEKIGLGAHATDFALGPLSLRASAGILYETQTDRLGPYVALAAWAPFSWSP